MPQRKTRQSLAPLLALISIACASNSAPVPPQVIQLPPVEVVRNVYPPISTDALVCLGEPLVPDSVETDAGLAIWAEDTRTAGADCRARLDWIRAYVATWPR